MTNHDPYLTETRCLKVDPRRPDARIMDLAGAAIRRGLLVAFPTETVYGLGANAFDAAAVRKIFRAKSRPANDPLIAHIADPEQLHAVAADIPDLAIKLLSRFSPGPLTLVLKKREKIPRALTAGLDTVALRQPDHPVALALIRAAGVPIAAPSANKFARPSPTRAKHVLDDLQGHVDWVLDGGETTIGLESTIVSLIGDAPRLLRPGAISLEALRDIAPELRYQPRYQRDDDAAMEAPGGSLRHYAPRARVLLFRGVDDAAVHAAMRATIAKRERVGLLALDADAAAFADMGIPIASLGPDADSAAKVLFAALRSLDQLGLALIVARAPETPGLGLALQDRLLRAATGHVIDCD